MKRYMLALLLLLPLPMLIEAQGPVPHDLPVGVVEGRIDYYGNGDSIVISGRRLLLSETAIESVRAYLREKGSLAGRRVMYRSDGGGKKEVIYKIAVE